MLYEKDFIKRLIQQLARALATALGLRQQGKHEQALEVIHRASGELLGLEWEVLKFGGMKAAVQLLADARKVKTYARLVEEEALTLQEMGRVADASASFLLARELYEEAMTLGPDDEIREAIARLS